MAEPRVTISVREDTQIAVKEACVRRKQTLIEAADEAFLDLLEKWRREARAAKPKRQAAALAV